MTKEPMPPQGYYLDRDSFYYGKNPFSGKSYQEYVLIADDTVKSDGQKNKKRKVKYRPGNYGLWLYKYAERQLDFNVKNFDKSRREK